MRTGVTTTAAASVGPPAGVLEMKRQGGARAVGVAHLVGIRSPLANRLPAANQEFTNSRLPGDKLRHRNPAQFSRGLLLRRQANHLSDRIKLRAALCGSTSIGGGNR
jgi:hypothetical protein